MEPLPGGIAYEIAKDEGVEGWNLLGWTVAGVVEDVVIGGAVGYGVGTLISSTIGLLGFTVTKYRLLLVRLLLN